MVSHFTMLPCALPVLVFMLMRWQGRWYLRLMSAGGFLLGVLLVLIVIFSAYPPPTIQLLSSVFSEGIVHGLDQGVYEVEIPGPAGALRKIGSGLHEGIPASVASIIEALKVDWCPWALAVVLPWIGVLGLGFRDPPVGQGGRAKRLWSYSDGAMGVALLLCLAPLPFFKAAQSPERYALNLLPLAALLFVRGLGSVCAGLDVLLRIWLKRWPRGILALVMGAPEFGPR